jgi:hypothetical protein
MLRIMHYLISSSPLEFQQKYNLFGSIYHRGSGDRFSFGPFAGLQCCYQKLGAGIFFLLFIFLHFYKAHVLPPLLLLFAMLLCSLYNRIVPCAASFGFYLKDRFLVRCLRCQRLFVLLKRWGLFRHGSTTAEKLLLRHWRHRWCRFTIHTHACIHNPQRPGGDDAHSFEGMKGEDGGMNY